ncbi:MAG: hypothetical protein ACHQFW_01160, partial [Chitinophagales bacterium]
MLPIRIANTCGWFYDEDELFISPFDQLLPDLPQLYPFFYSYHYYNWSWTNEDVFNDLRNDEVANINDWLAHWNNTMSAYDAHLMIYESTGEDLRKIKKYLTGSESVTPKFEKSPVVKSWKEGNFLEDFDYLIFAKEIEPLVGYLDYWSNEKRNVAAMNAMRGDINALIKKSNSPFIKQRYIYQTLRLAHYSGNYQECLNLYDKYENDLDLNSLIGQWCLSLRAGAYWRMNKFAESSYYNSLVFANCPSRKLYAERDFWIDNEATWQKCLAMTKNDNEKIVLWALTGINQNNSALIAMEEIAKLDARSEYLELLLAREVEKIQRNMMPERSSFTVSEEYNDYAVPEMNKLDDLEIFISKMIDGNKLRTPSFWFSSMAYLKYLKNDLQSTVAFSRLALTTAGENKPLKTQAFILWGMAFTGSLKEINSETELIALNHINNILDGSTMVKPEEYSIKSNINDAYAVMMHDLAQLYLNQGQLEKAEICRSLYVDYYDLYNDLPDFATVLSLYNYVDSKNNNAFDEHLKMKFAYSKDMLAEMLGTIKMGEFDFNAAISWFEKIADPEAIAYYVLPTDPFLIHLWDCHDCDFISNAGDLTKLELAKKIVELESDLQKTPENKAEIFHLLGNAYYN